MPYTPDATLRELITEAYSYAAQYGIPGTGSDDAVDAFRHAYSSALIAFKYGPNIAQLAGDYNEWQHPGTPEQKNMDQYNNKVGRDIADKLRNWWWGRPWATEQEIRDEAARLIYEAYQNGDLIVDPINDPRKFNGFDFFKWSMKDAINDAWNLAQRVVFRNDPLTLDLDGDGLETVGASESNVMFDHDGDGIKTATGWILGDDGFLVLDRNSNGTIDTGAELFGDSTPLYAGGTAKDGFAALAQEDTNEDGQITSADDNWSSLKVWKDLNQDGESQEGELFSLSSLGISSISVTAKEHSQVLSDGNRIADFGTFTRTSGSTGAIGSVGEMADIDLSSDTFHREFTNAVPLEEGVELLPEMKAWNSTLTPIRGRRL